MVIKYCDRLVLDYIHGNDIEDYDLETLENNSSFMMDVINYSEDKKMFDFCGDILKKDYDFIKFVVMKFKNDKRFIIKVAEEYLKEAEEDDINTIEFTVLMADLLPECTDDSMVYEASFHYHAKREAFYDTIMIAVEEVQKEENRPELGKGFIYFIDSYGTSDIILKYIAKKYILDIFYEDRNITLEQFLHRQFKDSRYIKNPGEVNFILNYVRFYDEFLADYLELNLDLISDLRNEISKIFNNWDRFMKNLDLERVETFSYEIEKYLDDPSNMCSFSPMQIENYFIRNFHLESFYHNYYDKLGENGKIFNPIYLDESYRIDDGPFTIEECRWLQHMGVLAKKIFFDNTLSDTDYQDIVQEEINSRKRLSDEQKQSAYRRIKIRKDPILFKPMKYDE